MKQQQAPLTSSSCFNRRGLIVSDYLKHLPDESPDRQDAQGELSVPLPCDVTDDVTDDVDDALMMLMC